MADRANSLRRVAANLTRMERVVVALRHHDRLSERQTAKAAGVPLWKARQLLASARRKARRG